MEVISIIFPTRNRPDNCKRLLESIKNTVSDETLIEVCMYIDSDDILTLPAIEGYNVKFVVGERLRNLSILWNEAYKLASGDIIMHCGDDIVFRTKNWDVAIRDAFNKYDDKIVLVYGDDTIMHDQIATHSFIHRKWIEVSGFFLPPYFSSDYNDLWLDNVARMINRLVYLPNVITEHMHYGVGKATIDQNTIDRLARHQEDRVAVTYDSKYAERVEHANKLKSAFKKIV